MRDKKAVKILFPNLTHGGKMYVIGDIEENPSPYLVNAAKTKLKQFHRDTNKKYRICRFYNKYEEDDGIFEDEDIIRKPAKVKEDVERKPVFVAGGYDDDLTTKSRNELMVLASVLGMKKSFLKTIEDNDKLREIVTSLRKI
uniref:Uncharacterized protein n=1 Tax=viral metagenome TaxID=1070528 RepID=A0A6M3K0N3_9ZZZZ